MSSSSTFNNACPILNVDNSLSNLVDDLNLNSKQDNPFCFPTYCDDFASPMNNYNELDSLDELFEHYQHHGQLVGSTEQVISSALTDDSSVFEPDNNKTDLRKVEEGNTNNTKRPSPTSNGSKRRRSSNKDRHSKIVTAQGLRDRRMRLSLEVAHPFFKLQDMLGYDKASRTVQWLLLQSKEAIEEVIRSKMQASPSEGVTKCTISSTSDCEVESITIDQENKKENCRKMMKRSFSPTSVSKIKVKRRPNRSTKESRIEARARARERTRKRLTMAGKQVNDTENHVGHSELLGHLSSFETREVYHGDSISQSNCNNGIFLPFIETPDQVNRSVSGNCNSLFSTLSYQPKW